MSLRQAWILGFIVPVLLLADPPSYARLSMDVSVGFDGTVISQSWAPVLVELFNDGPPVEGFVEVGSSMYSHATEYWKPIVLPSNSRKRLWLYPHVGNYEQELRVQLVAPNGRVITETTATLKTLPPHSILFAAATGNEMNLLPIAPRADETAPVFAVHVRPVALPDDAAGLEGLDALLLTDSNESEWTVGQRRAIRNWVALGGHLVVSVNNADNVIRSQFWDELLPIRVTGSEVVSNLNGLVQAKFAPADLPAMETPVAVGELQRGAIRARAGEVPLVVQASFGRGRITLLTFSMEREPFRSLTAAAKEAFWRRLMEAPVPAGVAKSTSQPAPVGSLTNLSLATRAPAPRRPVRVQPAYQPWGGTTVDDIFLGMLETRLERRISFWWLLVLVGFYLLAIGPFDYWLVRHKLKRPILTWITFPGYVIGFSTLIYGIGYALKSGDSELAQVSFVDVVPEANLARGTTIAGFYSTSNRRYQLEGTGPESHFRLFARGFENPSSSPMGGDLTRVIETDHGFSTTTPVPIWSSKAFVAQWMTSDKIIRVTGEKVGDGIRLRVYNELPATLTQIHVIANGVVQSLPDLAPDASEEKLLITAGMQGFDQWLTQGYGPVASQFQFMRYPFYRYKPDSLPPWNTVLNLLSFVERTGETDPNTSPAGWPGLDLSGYVVPGTIIVLAYADDFPIAGLHPMFRPDKTTHHALLRCVVKPIDQSSGMSLP